MPSTTAVALKQTIQKLQADRATHVAAIIELDKVFAHFGIKLGSAPKRGRPAKKRGRKPGRPKGKATRKRRGPGSPKASGKKKPGRPKNVRRRRKPSKRKAAPARSKKSARSTGKPTGDEFLIGVIRAARKAGAKSSEITTAWKKARRKGSATPYLFGMAKAGKIKKRKIKGQRGSVYRLA